MDEQSNGRGGVVMTMTGTTMATMIVDFSVLKLFGFIKGESDEEILLLIGCQ